MDLSAHPATLHRLARTDPDPRVRHRADALVLVATGLSLTEAARLLGRSRTSLRSWRDRFLAAGQAGLADRGLLADIWVESPVDRRRPQGRR